MLRGDKLLKDFETFGVELLAVATDDLKNELTQTIDSIGDRNIFLVK